jgi:hypothetical protein
LTRLCLDRTERRPHIAGALGAAIAKRFFDLGWMERTVSDVRSELWNAIWLDVEEVAMLEGQTRIPPVDSETLPDDLRAVLEEQHKRYGAPLYPYLFYARNPAYFRAAEAMWTALQQETQRVPGALRGLLNRRVASWNGCEF